MLRLTKNDKKQLANLNARIRRKRKNLKETFNISPNIEYKTPSQFKTRAEVNAYKEQARIFLAPYTHKYIKGGVKDSGRYYYPIEYTRYKQIERDIIRHNKQAEKLMKQAEKLTFYSENKRQSMTLAEYIGQKKKQYQNETDKRKKLGGRYQAFFPIDIYPERIKRESQLINFEYAIKNFNIGGFYNKRLSQAKVNFAQALENQFGSIAKPIATLIDALTPEEFLWLYESEDFFDFDYVYDETYKESILKTIAQHILNFMEEKDLAYESQFSQNHQDKLIDKIENIMQMDSEEILSEYSSTKTQFVFNNQVYEGSFRRREVEEIKNNINLERYARRITTKRIY